jgi:hypothetical protein
MERRSLLKSMLLSPLTFFQRQPVHPPHEAPYDADLRTGNGKCLPEVRWDSLSHEEQVALARMVDHEAAVFPADSPSHPRYSRDAANPHLHVYDRLYRLGLLTFTSKVPEHEYDLCGWYTISHYGREIVPASSQPRTPGALGSLLEVQEQTFEMMREIQTELLKR